MITTDYSNVNCGFKLAGLLERKKIAEVQYPLLMAVIVLYKIKGFPTLLQSQEISPSNCWRINQRGSKNVIKIYRLSNKL